MRDLETKGFALIHGISSEKRFRQVAASLGRVSVLLNGDVVDRIYPLDPRKARPRSFGSVNGKGAYPLHSDTAHWPQPARLILLRVVGDTRRPTTLCDTAKLFSSMDEFQKRKIRQSVWYSNFDKQCFTCSMLFSHGKTTVFRFDPQCMRPANSAAKQVNEFLPQVLPCFTETILWRKNTILAIANWRMLHGRGDPPQNESLRELQRILVN